MKKKIPEPDRIELSDGQISELQDKIKSSNLDPSTQDLVIKSIQGLVWLNRMLQAKKMSIKKLSRLFGFKTEKKRRFKDDDDPPSTSGGSSSSTHKKNGRNGHDKYSGAKRVFHQHETLKPGDRCPECDRGNLYELNHGTFINIHGAPPLQATVHETQKLRCSGCGKVFTATLPKEMRRQKYDETADVAIALQRYGTGVPHYRLEGLQKRLGVPLPASTQWDRVEELATSLYPVYEQLKEEAAQGKVSFIDDTVGKILDLKRELKDSKSERCGIYTTGLISKTQDRTIKLFFTGNKYAGENLDQVLKSRPGNLFPMIQMSDALANNRPKEASTIKSLCLVHARRNFIDADSERPKECAYVQSLLGKIFKNEKIAVGRGLNDEERMRYHQKQSALVVKRLRRWCLKSFYLKKIEPNEGTGLAIQYLLNHWEGLTQFLRIPGAPIENNPAERHLKKSILHRKNSLFYKTQLGAYVGDVIMSLIETCSAAGANPFHYLVELHRQRKEVKANPKNWFPWSYKANLQFSQN